MNDQKKLALTTLPIPYLFIELLSQVFSTDTTLTQNYNVIANVPENETVEIASGVTVQITGSQ